MIKFCNLGVAMLTKNNVTIGILWRAATDLPVHCSGATHWLLNFVAMGSGLSMQAPEQIPCRRSAPAILSVINLRKVAH